MSNTGVSLTGIERQALEDNLANRRKPRVFSTPNATESPESPYTLDFCLWLHRTFDALVAEINAPNCHTMWP